jgi:hypothetical protein
MRRLITLLILVLCFAAAARVQTADSASSHDVESKRKSLRDALDHLQSVTNNVKQPDEVPQRLNDDIKEGLETNFSPAVDLSTLNKDSELFKDIDEWMGRAKTLTKKGELFKAISGVYTAKQAYLLALNSQTTTPQSTATADVNAPSATPMPRAEQPKGEAPPKNPPETTEGIFQQWLPIIAMIATPLLAIGLFAVAFLSISKARREASDSANAMRQSITGLRGNQEAFAKQLESLVASNRDLFARLAELSAEIGSVNSRVQSARAAALADTTHGDTSAPDGNGATTRQAEPPPFPSTVDAYLRKMQRQATIVKPDFQNGILVADAQGELVLVEDTSISRDTLFVVPRTPQFQMKQDFYTYYERYYDCERPGSGTVWIVDPAVVARVQGGWELREKGVLEVR